MLRDVQLRRRPGVRTLAAPPDRRPREYARDLLPRTRPRGGARAIRPAAIAARAARASVHTYNADRERRPPLRGYARVGLPAAREGHARVSRRSSVKRRPDCEPTPARARDDTGSPADPALTSAGATPAARPRGSRSAAIASAGGRCIAVLDPRGRRGAAALRDRRAGSSRARSIDTGHRGEGWRCAAASRRGQSRPRRGAVGDRRNVRRGTPRRRGRQRPDRPGAPGRRTPGTTKLSPEEALEAGTRRRRRVHAHPRRAPSCARSPHTT